MKNTTARPIQKRSLKTRAKLLDLARDLIKANGYAALRVEELVARAGVAKGTFFAHFSDKDGLMSLLIGEEINRHLDQLAAQKPPQTPKDLLDAMLPMVRFMASERYVFDVIMRHSGSLTSEEIGEIALTLGRQHDIFAAWMSHCSFRKDVSADLLSEGIQAFVMQAIALEFCAIHNSCPIEERLLDYLNAWLTVSEPVA